MNKIYLTIFGLCASKSSRHVINGINEVGSSFTVRDGSSVTFDQEPVTLCTESFEFPGFIPEFVHSAAMHSDIVACHKPTDKAEDLAALVKLHNVSASTYCNDGPYPRFKLVCFRNGVAVSRRFGEVVANSTKTFASRIPCDNSTAESVVFECAESVKKYLSLIKKIMPGENQTRSQANITDKTANVETGPVTSQNTTNDEEEGRLLEMVSGRNQAGFSFEVLDGGIVSFIPRIGEECRESHILDGLSMAQRYNAVSRTSFSPCAPPKPDFNATSIDPTWDIIAANVHCADPVYISITCKVAFGDSTPVEFSRMAIRQAFDNPKYLSSRITCDAPSDKEKIECATIASNYLEISAQVSN